MPEAAASAAAPVAAAAMLIAITIYVFHGRSKQPIPVDAELPAGPHTFQKFQDLVVDAVLNFRRPLGFGTDQLLSGSLFVKGEPAGLPTRPAAGELPLKRGASILLSNSQCILLNLGDSVPAAAAAGPLAAVGAVAPHVLGSGGSSGGSGASGGSSDGSGASGVPQDRRIKPGLVQRHPGL